MSAARRQWTRPTHPSPPPPAAAALRRPLLLPRATAASGVSEASVLHRLGGGLSRSKHRFEARA